MAVNSPILRCMNMNMSNLAVTTNAVQKIGALLKERDEPHLALRVYIQGGGCSGFMYGFNFEAASNDDDMVVQSGAVKVVVDPLSYQYLMGAEVDYKEDLQGSRFVINNPNAATTCGCGYSFGI